MPGNFEFDPFRKGDIAVKFWKMQSVMKVVEIHEYATFGAIHSIQPKKVTRDLLDGRTVNLSIRQSGGTSIDQSPQ